MSFPFYMALIDHNMLLDLCKSRMRYLTCVDTVFVLPAHRVVFCSRVISPSSCFPTGGTNALALKDSALTDVNPVPALVLVALNRALQSFVGVTIFMAVSAIVWPVSAVELIRAFIKSFLFPKKNVLCHILTRSKLVQILSSPAATFAALSPLCVCLRKLRKLVLVGNLDSARSSL